MKGKLIKTSKDSHHNGHYFLNDSDGFAIGSTDKDWCKRAVSKTPLYILSLKNCEAIANGYDLDELAEEYASGKSSSDVFKAAHKRDFIAGTKAILEIIGDKKFSERQVRNAIAKARLCVEDDDTGVKFLNEDKDIIESLQQNEWDVEIQMEEVAEEYRDGTIKVVTIPKLDADGCLILKI